jgi:hypothetical protein
MALLVGAGACPARRQPRHTARPEARNAIRISPQPLQPCRSHSKINPASQGRGKSPSPKEGAPGSLFEPGSWGCLFFSLLCFSGGHGLPAAGWLQFTLRNEGSCHKCLPCNPASQLAGKNTIVILRASDLPRAVLAKGKDARRISTSTIAIT